MPLKGPGRIIEKLDDGREIKDALRSTLITPHPLDDIESIIAEFERRGYTVVPDTGTPFEDRISPGSRRPSGYGDIALKLLKGDGHEVMKEVLVMPDWMFKAKHESTRLYSLERTARQEGRLDDAARHAAAARQIYDDAEAAAVASGWRLHR